MTATAPASRSSRLSFTLPTELEAHEPPEARGLMRDGVRMLVANERDGSIVHAMFASLPEFLEPGDLVVINTSDTMPAAVDALASGDAGGARSLVIHFSTELDDGRWIVEPRWITGDTTVRWPRDRAVPREVALPGGGRATLDAPYDEGERLWIATLRLPRAPLAWLAMHGRPIRYSYVDRTWPLGAYRNVYGAEPGSAEMPSAGRPFTPGIITTLVAKGVGVTPLVLHTGVASLEAKEIPYPERVRVPQYTADRVNTTRAAGGRVVAIGTTVVRALESAASDDGVVRALDGWTDLVITPERGVRVVGGLLTGWHEPEASHLLMLEAIASRELLQRSYEASLAGRYLWHEFGDVHLILR